MRQARRGRGFAAATAAITLLFIALPQGVTAQTRREKIGEIVQPATGAGRAVYAPLDHATILPRFLGRWAARSGKCVGQKYWDRMELDLSLGILSGRALRVRTALVETDPQGAGDDASPRAADYANADDLLVGFAPPDSETLRYVHFHLVDRGARLIVEEVGRCCQSNGNRSPHHGAAKPICGD